MFRSVPAVTTEDCFIVDRSLNTSKLTAHRPGLVIEPGNILPSWLHI